MRVLALGIMGKGWGEVFSLSLRREEGANRTTFLGEEVLTGDMDVGPNLLVAVATRFGIKEIGMVAAAFLSCKRELFADVLDAGPAFGPSSRQLAHGEYSIKGKNGHRLPILIRGVREHKPHFPRLKIGNVVKVP